MRRHARLRPRWQVRAAVAVAGIGVAAASSAIGYAANTASGQIQACYNNTTGALRVVGSTPCTASETALDWAKVGPAGVSSLYHGFHRGKVSIPGDERPAAMVRTPLLAAGSYAVTVSGHYTFPGNAEVTCYLSRFVHVGDRTFNLPHHEEVVADPKVEWLTQTDYVTGIKAGQRIAWYCQAGIDPVDRTLPPPAGRIGYASINAIPVSTIHYSISN